jgi:hypothetical protein
MGDQGCSDTDRKRDLAEAINALELDRSPQTAAGRTVGRWCGAGCAHSRHSSDGIEDQALSDKKLVSLTSGHGERKP